MRSLTRVLPFFRAGVAGWLAGWTDRQIAVWIDGWMNGWVPGWAGLVWFLDGEAPLRPSLRHSLSRIGANQDWTGWLAGWMNEWSQPACGRGQATSSTQLVSVSIWYLPPVTKVISPSTLSPTCGAVTRERRGL
ncbi:hypothetical protein GGR51DRAFT_496487 [Nemania sp. FL0031]|nr:hypothetical protein GGR51DRAFT_496487 [Nemania sp. FL0031]